MGNQTGGSKHKTSDMDGRTQLRNSSESGQHRNWHIPSGGSITNGSGYLTRSRHDTYHNKWSQVPVGPVAVSALSKGLNERDHRILLVAEQLQVVTTEQIARAFFDSPITARNRIRLLRERRFLASPEADHKTVRAAVGRREGIHNVPLVLDWNGKYLLEQMHYDLRTWDPATVAQVNSRFGHTLGVNEVWSYVAAAARSTHDHTSELTAPVEPQGETGKGAEAGVGSRGEATRSRDRLAIGLLNERESVVYYEGHTGWSLELDWAADQPQQESAGKVGLSKTRKLLYRPLVKPDSTLVFSITSDAFGKAERAYREAVRKSNSIPSSCYQGSWHPALLQSMPSPAGMRAAEQLGSTRYRYLFLEMETGSNNSKDMLHKIARYNQLYNRLTHGDMLHGQSWRTLFGSAVPVILVVVRDSSQIERQVSAWRTHYAAKSSGAVILANLELLALAYAVGRSRLLRQPCWLDIMKPEGPGWKSLSEVFGLKV